MSNISLLLPSGVNQVIGRSGNVYLGDNYGVVSVPIGSGDLPALLDGGCSATYAAGGPIRNNFAATTNPGVTDDETKDYGIGSTWVNTSGQTIWTCVDKTTGAAVWTESGAIGSTTAVNVGGNGSAGTLSIYPATSAKGSVTVTTANNTGNTVTNLNFAAQAGARTITVPDQGGNSTVILTGGTVGTTGIISTPLALLHARNADGSALITTPATGNFTPLVTFGTSEALVGNNAKSNTKTDTAYWEYVLPENYIAGKNLTMTIHALYAGAGTIGTKTIQGKAYLMAAAGTSGADIGPGTTTNLTTSDAAITATITGTTLNPGSRVVFAVTTAIQETGGTSNLNSQINSVAIS